MPTVLLKRWAKDMQDPPEKEIERYQAANRILVSYDEFMRDGVGGIVQGGSHRSGLCEKVGARCRRPVLWGLTQGKFRIPRATDSYGLGARPCTKKNSIVCKDQEVRDVTLWTENIFRLTRTRGM